MGQQSGAGTAYHPVEIGRYVATAPCGCRAPTRAPLRRASSIGYCCILGGTIRRWPCSLASPSGARSRPLVWWLGLSRLTAARCICHAARCILVLHIARCVLHVACCMLHCSSEATACSSPARTGRAPLPRQPSLSAPLQACGCPLHTLNRTRLPFHCNHCSGRTPMLNAPRAFPSPPPALGGSHGNTSPQ